METVGFQVSVVFTLFLLLIFVAPIIAFIKVTLERRSSRSVELTEDSQKKFETIFAEPTERYIASLGNGYIINFLAGSNLASGFSIVSNKRVYFKGKCYYKEGGKLKKSFEERTVDLKDVTGTGYTRVNPTHLLITAISSFLVFFVMFIYMLNLKNPYNDTFVSVIWVLFYSSIATCSISLTSYILKRKNLFEISFAGGKIAFNTNLYDKSEIDDFQKQIRRAKDNVVESAHAQVAATTTSQTPTEYSFNLGVADELKKYAELLNQKLITQQEYEEVKKNLFSNGNK